MHDYEEEVELIWTNSERSKLKLGQEETVKYLQKKLGTCLPTAKNEVRQDLKLAKNGIGKMLFEIIVEIIQEHQHIKLKKNTEANKVYSACLIGTPHTRNRCVPIQRNF